MSLSYQEKIKKRLEKYFSEENVKKRIEKRKQYLENAKKRYREKRIKKFSDEKITLHEKDIDFYQKIWKKRSHYCENCNTFLGNNFKDSKGNVIIYRYAHILPKSVYPYLRHYEDNILLLCLNCHNRLDNSPKNIVENMNCYDSNKIENLKNFHKKLKEENNLIFK